MSNFLEKSREIREDLDTISQILNNKSDALFMVGLRDLGSFCSRMAERLNELRVEIKEMVNDEFNRSLKQTQDASDNVLKGVLAASRNK